MYGNFSHFLAPLPPVVEDKKGKKKKNKNTVNGLALELELCVGPAAMQMRQVGEESKTNLLIDTSCQRWASGISSKS